MSLRQRLEQIYQSLEHVDPNSSKFDESRVEMYDFLTAIGEARKALRKILDGDA